MRATMSFGPPARKPTTNLIGRLGNLSARAGVTQQRIPATAKAKRNGAHDACLPYMFAPSSRQKLSPLAIRPPCLAQIPSGSEEPMTYGTQDRGYPASRSGSTGRWRPACSPRPGRRRDEQRQRRPFQDTLYNLRSPRPADPAADDFAADQPAHGWRAGLIPPSRAGRKPRPRPCTGCYTCCCLHGGRRLCRELSLRREDAVFRPVRLPMIIGKNEALSEQLFAFHKYTGWLRDHSRAGAYRRGAQHHVIRRDNVLRRMLPRAMGGDLRVAQSFRKPGPLSGTCASSEPALADGDGVARPHRVAQRQLEAGGRPGAFRVIVTLSLKARGVKPPAIAIAFSTVMFGT